MTKISIYLSILVAIAVVDITLLNTGILTIVALLLFVSLIITTLMYRSTNKEQNKRNAIIANGVQTEGVVTRVHSSLYGIIYGAVSYEFNDKNGVKQEGCKYIGLLSFKYKKGSQVQISYLATNPQENTILTNKKEA